ncbi:MAG: HAD family hydrolase [Chloroflexi bacterium]|nr:HAD family hydrolase [Chloroflexota bacterium]
MTTAWFLDFDDTLATGATTWGIKYALPRLIEQHRLVYDEAALWQAILVAQEKANLITDPRPVVAELFETMGWPRDLLAELIQDVQTGYRPELFPDALPFLQQLQRRQQPVYVISNNPTAPQIAQRLGLSPYIRQVYTPQGCPGTQPKPDRSLWDFVLAANPEVKPLRAVIVGDDPWSDGAFAAACGLACWIVDREERFAGVDGRIAAKRVKSLLDIPVGVDAAG